MRHPRTCRLSPLVSLCIQHRRNSGSRSDPNPFPPHVVGIVHQKCTSFAANRFSLRITNKNIFRSVKEYAFDVENGVPMHHPSKPIAADEVFESDAFVFRETKTHARAPEGSLPLTAEMLLTQPSGNLFGFTQNAGMGWETARMLDPEFLILSTHGGMRAQDGTPIALGFHTGHWEVGLLVAEAAREL